ncbi:MAG TPA: hypothetical protein VGG70_12630 [Candidatus Cybelea sp.]
MRLPDAVVPILEPLPDDWVVAPGYDGMSPLAPASGAAEPLSPAGAADVAAAFVSLEEDDVFDEDLPEQADSAIATAMASERVKKRM